MVKSYIHTFTQQEQERLIHQAEYLVPWVHRAVDFSCCKKVLEIGCGVGAQLKILAKSFSDTHFTGIDFSSEQLSRAKILLRDTITAKQVSLAKASAYELPFADSTFDGIFLCWVLEHLEHPGVAMSEAARVLKNGGIMIATEVFNAGLHCDPPRTALMEYWREFNLLQREFGGHPDIGIRLATLAADCDFKDIELTPILPQLDRRLSEEKRREMADYFRGIFASGAGELVKRGRVTCELVAAMHADFDLVVSETDSVMVFTAFQVSARRRARRVG